MDKKELLALVKGALVKDASVNFADREAAAIDAILEYNGLTRESSYRELKKVGFGVIEEVLDEILPAQIEDIMGSFATVKSFARNEEVIYNIKNMGKRRALLSIVPGARGGVYRARRLDGKTVSIKTSTITAGVFVNLEDILLGTSSLGELMTNILDGVQYQIYKDIVSAMRTLKTLAPAANVASGAGIDKEALDKVIRVVGAYGKPSLICFHSTAIKFDNMVSAIGANPNFPAKDIDEIRASGAVSLYHGTPVIEIPNYLLDEENSQWIFSEADVFVIPSDVKPVVVAFQGEGYIQENPHALGGAEQNYHRMMGTAVLTYNNVGVYTDTTVKAAETGSEI